MGSDHVQLFSSMETDAIGEILNISLGSSATSVSELLGQPVNITTPEVKVIHPSEFDFRTYEPAIGVEINYVKGLSGKNILILKESDVKVIVGLLLQTDFSDQEFVMDEMNIGAICEVMNQMMGAAATALSQFLNRSINISPPNSFSIDNSDQFKKKYFSGDEDIVTVYFHLMISDMVNSEFINVMPIKLAKELIANFGLGLDSMQSPEPVQQQTPPAPAPVSAPAPIPASAPAPVSAPAPIPASAPAPVSTPVPVAAPASIPSPSPAPVPSAGYGAPAAAPGPPAPAPDPYRDYSISQAVYPSFDSEDGRLTSAETKNLGMIMSVPLQIAVEIGRTSRKIKDILDFSVGTIVELDKQAGSQVDVYVNGKAIAKGNVVVVDDYYGVRITEVSSNSEIMKLL